MELWVRSQSKENLLKIENLSIDNENKILGNLISDDNKSICDYWILGTYKSKQRALEILDEIQNSILGILTLEDIEEQEVKEYTGKATFSKVTKQLVYIMPDE